MYENINWGYWGNATIDFTNAELSISGGKVVYAAYPREYSRSTVFDLTVDFMRYIQAVRLAPNFSEAEEVIADVVSFEVWQEMTVEEQTEYIRNHPLYDAQIGGIYYSTQRTALLGYALSKTDDTVVSNGLSYSNISETTASGVADYLTWWDENSNYADKMWFQGYIRLQTGYFKGYYSNGRVIKQDVTSYESINGKVDIQFHYEYPWKIDHTKNDDYPFSPDFIDTSEKSVNLPFPNGLWRITPLYNDGYPYHWLMPMETGIDIWSMAHEREIRVYDIHEPQAGFDHNGLAVLDPAECVMKCELNGRWDMTLKHSVDDWGKWQYLTGNNVIKADGQLYRISQVENTMENGETYINVYAKHISYDLADVFVHDADIAASDGTSYLLQLMANRIPAGDTTIMRDYDFDFFSDLTGNLKNKVKMQSLLAAVIGSDDCLVNRFGGELYRDNFYLSVNQSMENSNQNGFAIRYGNNMTKIKQTIDFSTWVTDFRAWRNDYEMWAVSYGDSPQWAAHHHVQSEAMFTVPDGDWEDFKSTASSYWQTINSPSVSYEVEIATIKDDSLYKDFIDLQQFNVGDTGQIYIEQFGINVTVKIISVEKDLLTGEITSLILGNNLKSIIRSNYLGNTISSGNSNTDKQNAEMQSQVYDLAFVQVVSTPIVTVDNEYLMTTDGEFLLYKE